MSDDKSRIDDLIIKGIDRVHDKMDKVDDKVNHLSEKTANIETDVHELSSQFESHEHMFKEHLETDKKMYEEFAKMNDILRDNTESLKEHMRRTSLAEQAILKIDQRLSPIEQERLKKEAVREYLIGRWKRWLMYLGAISTALGIIGKLTGIF